MTDIIQPKAPPTMISYYLKDRNPYRHDQNNPATTTTIPTPFVTTPSLQLSMDTAAYLVKDRKAFLDGTGFKFGPDHGQYKTINTKALPNDPILKDFYIRFRYTSKQGIIGDWSKLYQFKRFHVKGS